MIPLTKGEQREICQLRVVPEKHQKSISLSQHVALLPVKTIGVGQDVFSVLAPVQTRVGTSYLFTLAVISAAGFVSSKA